MQSMLEQNSDYIDENQLNQLQVQALWRMLGKHIYGQSDHENQLSIMFQRYEEREEMEERLLNDFTVGRKISQEKINKEKVLQPSPPRPETVKVVHYKTLSHHQKSNSKPSLQNLELKKHMSVAIGQQLNLMGSTYNIASPSAMSKIPIKGRSSMVILKNKKVTVNRLQASSGGMSMTMNDLPLSFSASGDLHKKHAFRRKPAKRVAPQGQRESAFSSDFNLFREKIKVEYNALVKQMNKQDRKLKQKMEEEQRRRRSKSSPKQRSPEVSPRKLINKVPPMADFNMMSELHLQKKQQSDLAPKISVKLVQMNSIPISPQEVTQQRRSVERLSNGSNPLIPAPFLKVEWLPGKKKQHPQYWSPRVEQLSVNDQPQTKEQFTSRTSLNIIRPQHTARLSTAKPGHRKSVEALNSPYLTHRNQPVKMASGTLYGPLSTAINTLSAGSVYQLNSGLGDIMELGRASKSRKDIPSLKTSSRQPQKAQFQSHGPNRSIELFINEEHSPRQTIQSSRYQYKDFSHKWATPRESILHRDSDSRKNLHQVDKDIYNQIDKYCDQRDQLVNEVVSQLLTKRDMRRKPTQLSSRMTRCSTRGNQLNIISSDGSCNGGKSKSPYIRNLK